MGKELDPFEFEYTWKDCVLYALGIGAQPEELDYLYENAKKFKVFPTFAVVPSFDCMINVVNKLRVNPVKLLHGEQKVTLYKPIPKKGKVKSIPKVEAVYDKEKAALVVGKTKTYLEDGTELFDNEFKLFCRGEGGFGGDPGPKEEVPKPPEGKKPDFQQEYKTLANQALLYRLSGDTNPLHADPQFAKMAGFERPILHGLCTYGFTGRGIIHAICDGDPANFKSFAARFSAPVLPGDTIIVKGWKIEDKLYAIESSTNRGDVVLTNGIATLV